MSLAHRALTIPLLLAAVLGAPGAQAQPPATPPAAGEPGLFVLETREGPCAEIHPTVFGGSGLWLLHSGRTICRGQWMWALYLNEWDRRVTGIPGRDARWNSWDLDWRRGSVAVGYGLADGIELSLMVPYDDYQGSGLVEFDARQKRLVQGGRLHGREFFEVIDVDGPGNARFGAKLRLAERGRSAWASHLFVELPTGDDREAVATEGPGLGLGLAWSLGRWVINAGYYDPGKPESGSESDQLQLGVGHRRGFGDRLEWITELVSNLKTTGSGEHGETDVTSGVRWWPAAGRRLAVNLAVRVDLSKEYDTGHDYNPLGWLIGLSWAPSRWHTLDVATVGACRGTVLRQPAPRRCGREGAPRYLCSRTVRLTAVADDEQRCAFAGWGGDCAGSDPVLDLRVEGDTVCTARFEPVPAPPDPAAQSGRGDGSGWWDLEYCQ